MMRFAVAVVFACLLGQPILGKRMAKQLETDNTVASNFAKLSDEEKVKSFVEMKAELDKLRATLSTIKNHANRGCCKDNADGSCACSVGYGETCEEYCP